MKIEDVEVMGLRKAFKAMRNPMNSWNESDSKYITETNKYILGEKDLALALKLVKAGKSHRKFLRQIHVSVDLTLPRYIWQELDTYKVSTVRNSCSTMHKLGSVDLTKEDFQDDFVLPETLMWLNNMGASYRNNKSIEILRSMKIILPEGFLQKATYDCNYETLITIYFDRHNHRMSEWSGEGGICQWILSLPYMKDFINVLKNNKNG